MHAQVELEKLKAALTEAKCENEGLMTAAFKAAREAKEAQTLRIERDQATRQAFALDEERKRVMSKLEVFETCTFVEKALNSHKAAFEKAAGRFSSEMCKLLACARVLLTTHHTPCVQQSASRLRW